MLLQYRQHIVTHKRHSKQLVTALHTSKAESHKLGSIDDQFDEELEVKQFVEAEVDGSLLMVLKVLRTFCTRLNHSEFVEVCGREVRRLEAVKKEFFSMVGLWDRHSELLKAYDELIQCKSTCTFADLQLQPADMDCADAKDALLNGLAGAYWRSHESAMSSECDATDATNTLNFYKSQIISIHEEREQLSNASNNAGDCSFAECAICQESLQSIPRGDEAEPPPAAPGACEEVLLPCAHRFHGRCVLRWLQRHRRCPLCKKPSQPADLSLLLASPARARPKAVRGSWGTKVDALVADLAALQAPDKAIVFSQWTEVEGVPKALATSNDSRIADAGDRGTRSAGQRNPARVLLRAGQGLRLGGRHRDLQGQLRRAGAAAASVAGRRGTGPHRGQPRVSFGAHSRGLSGGAGPLTC